MMSPSGFPLKLSFYQSVADIQVHYGREYDINTYSPNSEKTRLFKKRTWVAFIIMNISELDKGNGELYMLHGNLIITRVYLRFS